VKDLDSLTPAIVANGQQNADKLSNTSAVPRVSVENPFSLIRVAIVEKIVGVLSKDPGVIRHHDNVPNVVDLRGSWLS
jgi:hypothetical protein